MNKDQRYSRIEQLGDDVGLTDNNSGSSSGQYRDDPRHDALDGSDSLDRVPMQRSRSTPTSAPNNNDNHHTHRNPKPAEHPLQHPQQRPQQQQQRRRSGEAPDSNGSYNNLRMRRVSPSVSRASSQRGRMSREGSSENLVVVEGMMHVDGLQQRHGSTPNGSITSPTRPSRKKIFKEKSSQDETSDRGEESDRDGSELGGSREDDGDGLFPGSSSFDLLDDEDEMNLQRYHRDFGASAYAPNYQDDVGWDDEEADQANSYHPRSQSEGSNSKDPWIRMVQNQNQSQSPVGGIMPLSAINSMNDLLLYLQNVRRQARQRRAQRLLTMPSEEWWERLQFCFMTYCWDATDVGLLVVAILLVIWFTGLLWLAKVNARTAAQAKETHEGAEYNANEEFDDYETHGGSWQMLFQWWWWGLGFVLLVRILGPFAVQNVNNRRRERRRQRFMSGNMGDQQRRMQQQQLPTIVDSPVNNIDEDAMSPDSVDGDIVQDSLSGVEITNTNGGMV